MLLEIANRLFAGRGVGWWLVARCSPSFAALTEPDPASDAALVRALLRLARGYAIAQAFAELSGSTVPNY